MLWKNVCIQPDVKGALLDADEVDRNEIIAQGVPFLNGRPERVRPRVPAQPDGVSRAGSVGFMAAAVRVVAVNGGPSRILAGIDIRTGSDAHVEPFSLPIDNQGA